MGNLTGLLSKSTDICGWFVKASRASRASTDMRTIMAHFGLDGMALKPGT